VRFDTDGPAGESLPGQEELMALLIRSDDLAITRNGEDMSGSLAVVGRGFTAHIFVRELIDVDAAVARLAKTLAKTRKLAEGKGKKLANADFVSRAPEEIIAKEKASLQELRDTEERLVRYLEGLES
jgi:valyl-tRNA synthetase